MDGAGFERLVEGARTCRRFEARELAREELLTLVEAARWAPCGNNSQVLRFRVVPGEDAAGCETVFSHVKWAGALKDWDGPEPGERPGGYIVICMPSKVASAAVRMMDVGIAAQTINLAAASRGLGACMHKSFDTGLSVDLGLEGTGYEAALVLSLGVRGEKVVAEPADTEHGLTYWRDAGGVHHVPKLGLDVLLI